jgi:hypothetical protein
MSNCKDEVVPVHAMKANVCGGVAPFIPLVSTAWRCVANFTAHPLDP